MKIGRITATGGSMRGEINQKAMSTLPREFLNRGPMVARAIRKSTPAISSAAHRYTPTSTTRVTANEPQMMNTTTMPIRGLYRNRSSAYAANEPMSSASTELASPTINVFLYGCGMNSRISRQAFNDGWKSTNGRYLGPVLTSIGNLNAVVNSQ